MVLPAVYVEAMRENTQQVQRQNSAQTLSGFCELRTITALDGQISHGMLPRLIHSGFFRLRTNGVWYDVHTGPNGSIVSKAYTETAVLHELFSREQSAGTLDAGRGKNSGAQVGEGCFSLTGPGPHQG